jgi:hypothetical protein
MKVVDLFIYLRQLFLTKLLFVFFSKHQPSEFITLCLIKFSLFDKICDNGGLF